MGKLVKEQPVNIAGVLKGVFPERHTASLLKHYQEALLKYQEQDWEGTLSKIGKFVEATLKAIATHANMTLPASRQFKVGQIVNQLQSVTVLPDALRIQIPKAAVFIYDISCNRGARHDPDEINPNKMDSSVAVPVSSWILSELVRFADKKSNPDLSASFIESLMEKKHPLIEDIDGRMYVNHNDLSAKEVGILILNAAYPRRIAQESLLDFIMRHGFSKNNAAMAITRLSTLIDNDNGKFQLRGLGRFEADSILSRIRLND